MPIFVDAETQSLIDLREFSSWSYARHFSTRVLMWSFCDTHTEPIIIEKLTPPPLNPMTQQPIPYISWGRFDQEIAEQVDGLPPTEWIDARKLALFLNLPAKLEDCATALGIGKKEPEGRHLIRKYCKPLADGAPLPTLEGEDKEAFERYALQDVVLLRAIWLKIKGAYPEWQAHQQANDEAVERMNARGVPIDRESCVLAMAELERRGPLLVARCQEICGFNPTQIDRLKEYLGLPNLQKETVEAAISGMGKGRAEVAQIRLEVGKASVSKLLSMWQMSAIDGRVHGCFTNNGAGTGRLTSQKPQLQNMKRSSAPEGYFERLRDGVVDDIYAETSLASRGFIKAEPGHTFIGSDYSSVEARVCAWAAGETKLLKAFKAGAPVYKMFAAKLYGRKHSDIEKGTDEYQSGKMAILAGGYGLGGKGLMAQASSYGLYDLVEDENRCWDIVNLYRSTFPKIVQHWADLEAGFEKAMGGLVAAVVGPVTFSRNGQYVVMRLPSRRPIWFWRPKKTRVLVQRTGRYRDEITFQGRLKNGKIGTCGIYGGKLCAYECQGIAADLMLEGMRNLEAMGFEPCMSVHDEITAQIPKSWVSEATQELFDKAICAMPEYAAGIPLVAEGWSGEDRYGKY